MNAKIRYLHDEIGREIDFSGLPCIYSFFKASVPASPAPKLLAPVPVALASHNSLKVFPTEFYKPISRMFSLVDINPEPNERIDEI
jgi:hypothetical protein